MTNIQIFENPEFGQVRTTEYNGEIAFVAKDVLERLGYEIDGGIGKYMKHVPDEWRGGNRMSTPGGEQEMAVLTEQGLYFFLARSDKPLALPFQKWIAGEVVPSIRKTGGYAAPRKSGLALVQEAMEFLITENKTLQARIEADRPKVLFSEAVETAKTDILIGEFAKILKQNGVDVGQNRLFEWLRKHGYLCSKGELYNSPTQRAMDLGLFRVKVTTKVLSDDTIQTFRTTKVTGKGQVYFVNKFLGRESLSAEVGGAICVADYNGNDRWVEGATSPFATSQIPQAHFRNDEPLEH